MEKVMLGVVYTALTFGANPGLDETADSALLGKGEKKPIVHDLTLADVPRRSFYWLTRACKQCCRRDHRVLTYYCATSSALAEPRNGYVAKSLALQAAWLSIAASDMLRLRRA